MTDRATQPESVVRLNKLVQASPQQVYDTWLDAEQYGKWFAPDPRSQCTAVSIDAKVGGQMRVVMQTPNGTVTGVGTFTELVPGKRIAQTWGWEEMPEFGGGSTLTLDFYAVDNPHGEGPATEIVLTHDGLSNALERSEHTGGWWATLRAIGYFVRGVDPREAMHGQTTQSAG